ncbi:MAG: hypothetical protein PW792_00595 [Acidobacteriaceae bacterium]|nr:hypothetical protein [Acidobacteriaceae bacterium]
MRYAQRIAVVALLLAGSLSESRAQIVSRNQAEVVLEKNQFAKGDRMIAAHLEVHGAHFQSLANLPLGWTATVDSPNATTASVELQCLAKCNGLDEASVRAIALHVERTTSTTSDLSVTGSFTVRDTSGAERKIPVSQYSFHFDDVFSRRRLRP